MTESDGKISKASILIVDDTPENLELLSGLLKDFYQVRVANNGERALAIINRGTLPDLILLDIMMPGMDGFEVCRQLKQFSVTNEIPVIFISAMNDVDNIVKSFEVGAVDYITKPFHFDEVHARVKTHLDLRHAKAEVELLLSNTLVGSVKFMVDLLDRLQPSSLARQSNRLRKYARGVISRTEIPSQEAWVLQIATMLLNIGCISLPNEIIEKAVSGNLMQREEQQLFERHILAGTDMIMNIPRLDRVAELIRNFYRLAESSAASETLEKSGAILQAIVEYDRLIMQNVPSWRAVNKLSTEIPSCPQDIFAALEAVSNDPANRNLLTVN